jgi:lysophospholipid acyltransferase (LPLAT)-like uncharacterized protein
MCEYELADELRLSNTAGTIYYKWHGRSFLMLDIV